MRSEFQGDCYPADPIGTTEAGRLVSRTPETIRGWINAGRIRGWRALGEGPIVVSRAEVLAIMVRVGPVLPPPRTARQRAHDRAMEECRRVGCRV